MVSHPTNINKTIVEDIVPEYTKPDGDHVDKMVEFLCTIGRLKSLDRAGWTLRDYMIPKPESVAGHMYRMGIISMLFDDDNEEDGHLVNSINSNDQQNGQTNSILNENKSKSGHKLDVGKLVKMSLIHDISECIVGDITPFDGISEDEKHRREINAMKHLTSLLPDNVSQKFFRLYEEYETRESEESKIVKELDRFDVMLQAFQYEQSEYTRAKRLIRFENFFEIALKHVHHPKLRPMVLRVVKERENFWSQVQQSTQNTNNK